MEQAHRFFGARQRGLKEDELHQRKEHVKTHGRKPLAHVVPPTWEAQFNELFHQFGNTSPDGSEVELAALVHGDLPQRLRDLIGHIQKLFGAGSYHLKTLVDGRRGHRVEPATYICNDEGDKGRSQDTERSNAKPRQCRHG